MVDKEEEVKERGKDLKAYRILWRNKKRRQ